jgi:hypothetical protein
MNPTIEELTAAVEQEARKRPEALRLMTHPGVGPLTALAYVLIIGTPERFHCGKQIGTYVGMIPSEDSSARNGWGTSASKVIRCCDSCWWRPPRRQHEAIRRGDVGTFTWRCVDTRALPRQQWGGSWGFACTGCGGMDVRIRRRSSSVRTWDSSVSDMV